MKKITIYVLCLLFIIGMAAPTATISAASKLELQCYNKIRAKKTKTIGVDLKLTNKEKKQVNLSGIKVRYYFTKDGKQNLKFSCSSSSIDKTKVTGTFGSVKGKNADTYLEVGFSNKAGKLSSGKSIKVRVNIKKSDLTKFNQSNDYSFQSSAKSYKKVKTITLYQNKKLILGTLPKKKPAVKPTVAPATPTPTVSPTSSPSTPEPTTAPTVSPVTPTPAPPSAKPETNIPEIKLEALPVPTNEAMTFVKDMKLGWNLGNTFDAVNCTWLTNELDYESGWSGATTTKQLMDTLKEQGVRTVRIPVSWHNHVSEDYTISEAWINRVQEVVDYCIDNQMYVIINIHHDTDKNFYFPSSDYLENSTAYMTRIWEQVAEKFKDYDDHLIFEGINEPRLIGHTNEWWIDPNNAEVTDSILCINKLNQVFVDTVRKSGSKNESRYLMCPGYDASPDGATDPNFQLPKDLETNNNKIIVSVHAYTPYEFALQKPGTDSWSINNTSNVDSVNYFMDKLYNTYTNKGIPVVIGEFGALDKNGNLKSRVEFSSYYVAAARARGITCVWWDNHAFSGDGELFGLIDRKTYEVKFPEILTGMVRYSSSTK